MFPDSWFTNDVIVTILLFVIMQEAYETMITATNFNINIKYWVLLVVYVADIYIVSASMSYLK